MMIHDIDRLIAAACPIDGINSSGDIFYRPEATSQQRAEAEALMAQYLPLLNDIEETDFGTINAKALVRRRAADLSASGNQYKALLLLKTIGE